MSFVSEPQQIAIRKQQVKSSIYDYVRYKDAEITGLEAWLPERYLQKLIWTEFLIKCEEVLNES